LSHRGHRIHSRTPATDQVEEETPLNGRQETQKKELITSRKSRDLNRFKGPTPEREGVHLLKMLGKAGPRGLKGRSLPQQNTTIGRKNRHVIQVSAEGGGSSVEAEEKESARLPMMLSGTSSEPMVTRKEVEREEDLLSIGIALLKTPGITGTGEVIPIVQGDWPGF